MSQDETIQMVKCSPPRISRLSRRIPRPSVRAFRCYLVGLALGCVALLVNQVNAATFTWTQITAGNASGKWTNQLNWTGAALPTTTNDTADFSTLDLTTDSTVTLDGNRNIGAILFADTATATGASWIVNAGSPSASMLSLGGLAPTINVTSMASGEAAVINAVLTGSGGLTKSGTGFLQLNAANTYSGGTFLSGSDCRFSVGNSGACGTGPIIVGATAGASQVWFNAAGPQTLTNYFEIRTTRWIIDSTTVNGIAAGDLTVNGNVLLNNGSSNVRDIYPNGKNLVINGNITASASINPLNKNGGSTLTLNGSNFVQAASAVNAGALYVNGPMNGGATFTVKSGALLGGTGVFSGTIVVSDGGKLKAGVDGTGTLTCAGLTAGTNAQFYLSLDAPGNPANGAFRINGDLTLAGTLNVTDLGGLDLGVYTNFYYSGNLVDKGLSIVGAPPGVSIVVDSTSVPHCVLLRVLAGRVSPLAGAGVPMDSVSPLTLSWVEMVGVTNYDIYWGMVSNAVAAATTNTAGIYLGRTNVLTFDVAQLLPNTTYYWRVDGVKTDGSLVRGNVMTFTTGAAMVDLMQDTWVATDALDRSLPGYAECGAPRSDRPVGIFYFLWHNANGLGTDGPRDNTLEIQRLGGYTDPHNPWADNPTWMSGSNGRSWYWGEPENGYYANDDEWVIRRHIALLEAAGVDVLGFDSTNGHPENQAPNYLKIYAVIQKMRMAGIPVHLKTFHYTHGGVGGSLATATWLYDNFYRPGLYSDFWFRWQGKPLIVGYPDGFSGDGSTPVTSNVRDFFTWKTGWAYVKTTLSNEWQWVDTPTRQDFGYSLRTDIPEQMPVTCGGWANGNLGRSFRNGAQPNYDSYHLSVNRTENQGYYFSEQAFQGLKADPQFLWITGWNEWWAGAWDAATYCYTRLLADCVPAGSRYFVDNYNAEYSRDIEPMKNGYTDNYYYQLVSTVRQRKGVRPVPVASAARSINLTGDFSDWAQVGPEYRDYVGDTVARNWPGTFGNLPSYTNNTGRNDFSLLKVARDATNFYFFAQCVSNLTSYTGSNWMCLFINVDGRRATGWEGYDYAVNLGTRTATTTSLSRSTTTNNTWDWSPVRSDLPYKVIGNQLMLAVPRAALGLTNDPVTFDFHWADNFQTNNISSFFVDGDNAPERRFNYRYQTGAGVTNLLCADNFDAGKQPLWGSSWTNGGKWDVTSSESYAGACAIATGGTGASQDMLTVKMDTSKLKNFRVGFRYKLANVLSARNLKLEFFTPGGWVPVRNLGRDEFYTNSQAWSYDERQNVWLYCAESRPRNAANEVYFATNFAVRINASGLTTASQMARLDDFQITGVSLSNNPPVIAPVADRVITAGQTLLITNSVSDPDWPAQAISWSLLSAPSNATLDAASGVFRWRPSVAQSPATNLILEQAMDNGGPPLGNTRQFTVTVVRPAAPTLGWPVLSNGIFSLRIAGDPGLDYVLFTATNLGPSTAWLPLRTNLSATPPFNFTVPVDGTGSRFYRVQIGP